MDYKWIVKMTLLTLILGSFGCSSSQSKKKPSPKAPIETGKRPEWIEDPGSQCFEVREICAVGEGPGAMMADASARRSLAQIFKTRIKSSTSIQQTSIQTQDPGGLLSGSVRENVSDRIEEHTDQLLSGVEVKKRYMSKTGFFSYVVLNRKSAGERVRRNIKIIDEEMLQIKKAGKRSAARELAEKFLEREQLAMQYQVLMGQFLKSAVSFRQIQELRGVVKNAKKSVCLVTRAKKHYKSFNGLIKNQLTDNLYSIREQVSARCSRTLTAALKVKSEYLKVEGFVKNRYVVKIEGVDGSDEKIGSLFFSVVKTGRDEQDTYSKAFPEIEKKIDNRFNEMNLD